MKPEEERSPKCLLAAELVAVKAQIRALRARETALVRQLTCGTGQMPAPESARQAGKVVALTRAHRQLRPGRHPALP